LPPPASATVDCLLSFPCTNSDLQHTSYHTYVEIKLRREMKKVVEVIANTRKFIAAAVGLALVLNIEPDTVQAIVAVLTAAGVYVVPNEEV
jgi:hypothetical protein